VIQKADGQKTGVRGGLVEDVNPFGITGGRKLVPGELDAPGRSWPIDAAGGAQAESVRARAPGVVEPEVDVELRRIVLHERELGHRIGRSIQDGEGGTSARSSRAAAVDRRPKPTAAPASAEVARSRAPFWKRSIARRGIRSRSGMPSCCKPRATARVLG
jgi:hypothetical protein